MSSEYIITGDCVSLSRTKKGAILRYEDPQTALRLLEDLLHIAPKAYHHFAMSLQKEIDADRWCVSYEAIKQKRAENEG